MTTPSALPLQLIAGHYLGQYLDKITRCVGLLSEDEVWWRPAPGTNSIANLLLHLRGNLSLWILNTLGGESNPRHRSAEFAADRSATKDEALAGLVEVVDRCQRLLARLGDAELDQARTVQGYATDGRGALFHAVEHMSYHTGQIVWITKQATAGRAAIEFYPQHQSE
jgi:uncharacterized damage-inducible protein DinB